MIFRGSQARVIEATVEAILKAFLQSRLDDAALPYAADMAPFGGADVVFADEEETRAEQGGRPYIVLEKTREEKEVMQVALAGGTIERGAFRTFTYRAEAVASEFTGALTGVENPVGADEILSGALESIIDGGFEELAALGLEEAQIEPQSESQENDELLRVNSHLISFAVTTVYP